MGLLDRMIGKSVEKYLSSMLANGQTDAEFANLVFDAARAYAQNNGAKYYADIPESIGFDKKLNGKNYNVLFIKGRGGRGTSITLRQQQSARDRMEAEIATFTQSPETHDIEFQSALMELDKMSETDVNLKRPSWDGNKKLMEELATYLSDSLRSTVPTAYWAMLLETPGPRGLMLSFVSLLEDNGASFPMQKAGAVRFVVHAWERLGPEYKSQFAAFGKS